MKHIFIVETADDVYLSPRDIDVLTIKAQEMVEACVVGHEAFAQSICNQKSAIRAVYAVYGADQTQSPDQLGSAK